MDQPRDDFLTNTGFAGDQHFRIRTCRAIDIRSEDLDPLTLPNQANLFRTRRNQQRLTPGSEEESRHSSGNLVLSQRTKRYLSALWTTNREEDVWSNAPSIVSE